jgi:PIN domain nuclease of toxin-antitoxin system
VKYLLDTNVFLWAVDNPKKLSPRARRILARRGTSLWLSLASVWGILTKCSIGTLEIANPAERLPLWMERLELGLLPIEARHVYDTYGLPLLHRDPFDRLPITQAIREDLTLLASDEQIQRYPVKWLW